MSENSSRVVLMSESVRLSQYTCRHVAEHLTPVGSRVVPEFSLSLSTANYRTYVALNLLFPKVDNSQLHNTLTENTIAAALKGKNLKPQCFITSDCPCMAAILMV